MTISILQLGILSGPYLFFTMEEDGSRSQGSSKDIELKDIQVISIKFKVL